jgi:hypothetical protein
MKKEITPVFIGAAMAIGIFATSCSKTNLTPETTPASINKVMGTKSPGLDYEHLSSFPYGPNNSIPAPWAGGIGRAFPVSYLNDYKASDGWELYFNTFNANKAEIDPYFIIYNRYRGIMRMYYYMSPKSGAETDHVTFQLQLKGTVNNSSILNFEQGELIDHNALTTVTSKMQNELIAQSGTWYAEEFEMAYDPNLPNTGYSANQLNWVMYSASLDRIQLDGSVAGTIDGTIQTPQPTSTFFGSLLKGAISIGTGQLAGLVNGASVDGSFLNKLFGKEKLATMQEGIKEAAKGAIKDGGKSIFNAVLGQVKGDNGGPGFSEQKINMKLDAKISLAGSIKHNPNGMFTPVVFISNTQGLNEMASGSIPNYDYTPGVFNITKSPTVNIYSLTPAVDPESNKKVYEYGYRIDDSSFSLIFNPAVQNISTTGASIANLKQEVVLLSYNTSPAFAEAGGNVEYIGTSKPVLTGVDGIRITHQTLRNVDTPPQDLYVRVSFDVVPNNGAATVKIIKTFKADVVFK